MPYDFLQSFIYLNAKHAVDTIQSINKNIAIKNKFVFNCGYF